MDVKVKDGQTLKDELTSSPDKTNVPSISWSDYRSKILPFGAKDQNDTKRINREWRRWGLADKDANNRLTKQEFKVSLKNIKVLCRRNYSQQITYITIISNILLLLWQSFLFPQLLGQVNGNNEASETIVSEAHEALDFDPPDGKISKKEFLEIHKQR